jgi:hypothetical protein
VEIALGFDVPAFNILFSIDPGHHKELKNRKLKKSKNNLES